MAAALVSALPWVIPDDVALKALQDAGTVRGIVAVVDAESYSGVGQPRSVSLTTRKHLPSSLTNVSFLGPGMVGFAVLC